MWHTAVEMPTSEALPAIDVCYNSHQYTCRVYAILLRCIAEALQMQRYTPATTLRDKAKECWNFARGRGVKREWMVYLGSSEQNGEVAS